ncbi:hypothetical protein AX15_000448 [Amanita polypyramis BW_CC]|nr:hypothetical protein AX15_000448 [Amanita polypyramis BW_CC]
MGYAMAQFLPLSPLLPLDVLRLIFEYTVLHDRRTGVALSTLSKMAKRWVEPVLYSVVSLQRPNTKLLFLRTVETSKTKKPSFFSTNVKTLCIAHDPSSDNRHTIKIISACPGVINLTFLSIPMEQKPRYEFSPRCFPAEEDPHPSFKFGMSFDSLSPSSGKFLRDQTALILRKQSVIELRAALAELKPTHVSTLLPVIGPEADVLPQTGSSYPDEWLSPPLPITLNLPLLLYTTHLSIQNKWEDWVSWAGCFDFARLRYLTHLSLDLRASFSTPRSKTARSNEAIFPVMDSCDTERACIIARASQCILTQCPRLRVCALRLIFDSNPDRTATAILAQMPLSRHVNSCFSMEAMKGKYESAKKGEVGMMDTDREDDDESDLGNDDDEVIIDMVDPRLVFLWDREPFQNRESHSKKERQIWMKSEEAVERQSIGLGHIVISV